RAARDRVAGRARRSRRAAVRRLPLHGGPAGSGPADTHERRDAHQQLPVVADRVRRDLRHRDALARLPPPPPARIGAGVPEAGAAVRRHHVSAGCTRAMTRVISGVVLAAAALAAILFLPIVALRALAAV